MMKKLKISIVLCAVVFSVTAQDTIMAENIFFHAIKNGQATPKKRIEKQITYDLSMKKVLRVINYDTSIHIISLINYYYQDDQLVSEEEYTGNNDLISVKRYTYTPAGKPGTIKIYKPLNNKMDLISTTTILYDDTLPVSKITKNRAGKNISTTTYSYLPGKTIEETRYRKGNSTGLKQQTLTTLFSQGKEVSQKTEKLYFSNYAEMESVEFSYNTENGKLTKSKVYDEQKVLKNILIYKYRIDDRITATGIADPDEKYIEYRTHAWKDHVVDLDMPEMVDVEKPLSLNKQD